METRSVKMTLETAKRWKAMGGEYEQVALETFPELADISNEWKNRFIGNQICGFNVDYLSNIVRCEATCSEMHASTFKTEKQAKSALAYAQLTQLMALPEYNGDWVADWSVPSSKYVITVYDDHEFIVVIVYRSRDKIAFKSQEIAELFIKNNLNLLKQYHEL